MNKTKWKAKLRMSLVALSARLVSGLEARRQQLVARRNKLRVRCRELGATSKTRERKRPTRIRKRTATGPKEEKKIVPRSVRPASFQFAAWGNVFLGDNQHLPISIPQRQGKQ